MTTQTQKQQAIFPDLPRDQIMVDKSGNVTAPWLLFFQQLTMALQTNYKPEGLVVPPKTGVEITLLTGDSTNNNIIYDTTSNAFKGNINGIWKTFLS